jgi:hypothetical protein
VRKLESDNLKLSSDLETEKGKVAGLQTDAANAKAAQQRVEIDLAKQRERTAKAELELKELRPRKLSESQQKELAAALLKIPKIPLVIQCVLGDNDGCPFAEQIKQVFVSCGWNVDGSVIQAAFDGNPTGIFLHVPKVDPNAAPNLNDVPPSAISVQEAFFSIGVPLGAGFVAHVPAGSIEILVGRKP